MRLSVGEVAEWLMAADCKSALLRVRWFESSPLHHDQFARQQSPYQLKKNLYKVGFLYKKHL